MNRLRAFAAGSPLRRILLHERVRPVIASVAALRFVPAAFAVRRPDRFLANELFKRGERHYRLRESGCLLYVRHGEGALELLDDIFRHRTYDPPPALVELIGTAPRILDVGANVGAFCAFARGRWPRSNIIAIEPDNENVAVLRHLIEDDQSGSISLIAAAASTSNEPVRFLSGLGTGSAIRPDGTLTEAVDLLAMLNDCDLVKIDIERGEWPILADERLASGGRLVIALEYHRRWPGDTGALDEAQKLLREAGFEVGYIRPNYWGHGTLWAWRNQDQAVGA